MKTTIHLSTEDGTNARVPLLRGRRLTPRTMRVTALGEEVQTRTVHRGNARVDAEMLTTQALVEGDPEIGLATIGRILPETTRAYRRPGAVGLEGNFQVIVTTYAADGTEKDRAVHTPRKANINELAPVRIGKRIPLAELFQRFVFHNQFHLGHEDGLQHEFLLAIARRLEAASEAAMLGAGPKGNQPLVLQTGGTPTRAFLLGETDGEKYRLRVLLTRQELKVPEARTVSATD
ncbi:MAG TPA: hypothetical protein VHG28_15165 [Longimicrobiaceae bacterium]|nr:hypothetical protein [Longimicrobiaceae bacterium]